MGKHQQAVFSALKNLAMPGELGLFRTLKPKTYSVTDELMIKYSVISWEILNIMQRDWSSKENHVK